MIILNASSACGEPSSPRVRSVHRRTVTVAMMLALAATFTFAAAPSAAASMNNHMSYPSGRDCGGGNPDPCPPSGPGCPWPCYDCGCYE